MAEPRPGARNRRGRRAPIRRRWLYRLVRMRGLEQPATTEAPRTAKAATRVAQAEAHSTSAAYYRIANEPAFGKYNSKLSGARVEGVAAGINRVVRCLRVVGINRALQIDFSGLVPSHKFLR